MEPSLVSSISSSSGTPTAEPSLEPGPELHKVLTKVSERPLENQGSRSGATEKQPDEELVSEEELARDKLHHGWRRVVRNFNPS